MADDTKQCSVAGCANGGHIRRGMCSMHYQRVITTGDPGPAGKLRYTISSDAIPGTIYGNWTVLGNAPSRQYEGTSGPQTTKCWHVQCICGKEYDRVATKIKSGKSKSCGCRNERRSSPICTSPECNEPTEARNLCRVHYRAWLDTEAPRCSVADCGRPAHARGMCGLHRAWVRRYGKPEKPPRPRPKPGIGGYIPITRNGRTRPEHVWLMEDLLGRPLRRDTRNRAIETVHHINGIKDDNRVDGALVGFRSGNLELWSNSHPSGQRVDDKVAWAVDVLALYAPGLLA